jgi:hypothetical protein
MLIIKLLVYTCYYSKFRVSVGIKMSLGKVNIVILWFHYLMQYKFILSRSMKLLSNITLSQHLELKLLKHCEKSILVGNGINIGITKKDEY